MVETIWSWTAGIIERAKGKGNCKKNGTEGLEAVGSALASRNQGCEASCYGVEERSHHPDRFQKIEKKTEIAEEQFCLHMNFTLLAMSQCTGKMETVAWKKRLKE